MFYTEIPSELRNEKQITNSFMPGSINFMYGEVNSFRGVLDEFNETITKLLTLMKQKKLANFFLIKLNLKMKLRVLLTIAASLRRDSLFILPSNYFHVAFL